MLNSIYPILEKKLRARGIRDFEVFYERKATRTYEAKDLILEAAKEAVQAGIALRAFQGGRVAFSYSTDTSEAGLERIAAAAADMLPFVDADEANELPEPRPIPPNLDLQDRDDTLDSVPTARKIEMAFALERSAKAYDARVKYVRSATFEEEQSLWEIQNSKGLSQGHRKTDCSLLVMAVAEDGAEAESAYEFEYTPYFSRLNPEKVGRAAAQKAVAYLGGFTPPTRKQPVIFDALITAEILEVLGGSFQGDEVFKGRSFLKNKLNQAVYSPLLNLVDDGLLPGGVGSRPFDGEGQPGRSLSLMENGVLKNYLLDQLYARKLQMPGNASSVRKSFRKFPGVSYANLLLRPGTKSLNELASEVGEGILVTETIGMHAANPISGEFSVGVQGFLIERGSITRPVKKLAVAGNLHQMMADVKGVGSEVRYYSNIVAPALLIDSLSVSGT